ncbi:hypothetical protein GUITHDRAFT_110458 [Guillardia theta CCMP2712]|uniref:Uncharacterized protein n=1 Tax=Guillardia theta (strain CCMP2712) TaxID=905079 RepID=L1J6C2_GUITC|nr:hypothetical protein GUITHDRAFT_110458 [Guillardia theta CCMP2712]EKX43659.1 hypothetical protein GUITHDRAFT_110458 [Guillardia theta CCMP2712]|eukprot:XP_005830639.1 hypothetical protein GUITHDRAFT_110458 [Guillardia theta CCMP2712]
MVLLLSLLLAMTMAAGGEGETTGLKMLHASTVNRWTSRGCQPKSAKGEGMPWAKPSLAMLRAVWKEDRRVEATRDVESSRSSLDMGVLLDNGVLYRNKVISSSDFRCLRLLGGGPGEQRSTKSTGAKVEEEDGSYCGVGSIFSCLCRWIKGKLMKHQDKQIVREQSSTEKNSKAALNLLLSTTGILALRSILHPPSTSPSSLQLMNIHGKGREGKQERRTFLENCVRSRELMERALEDGKVELSPRYVSSFGIITGMLWASVCGEIFSSLLPGQGEEEGGGG